MIVIDDECIPVIGFLLHCLASIADDLSDNGHDDLPGKLAAMVHDQHGNTNSSRAGEKQPFAWREV